MATHEPAGKIMRFLLLIMLWLLTMPHAAMANDESLEGILKKPLLTRADRDELFRQGLDDPKRLIQGIRLIWDRPAQEQSDFIKARTGWLIGLFMNNVLKADQRLDAETILRETEDLTARNKFGVSLKEIQFLRLYVELIRTEMNFLILRIGF
ncbi:MAG TPA: hypothetical protein VE954_29415 [Oligoflexus sp.]|uniref:hypothetical protein n=1 Tax=Oligoflexus sp. TaxID=1971216 RepID=UPI002D62D10D|nr:hypothetical protein [Oligoflexus sp.]HYX37243.1 hypothetical protein [Oligoflexus sp.]